MTQNQSGEAIVFGIITLVCLAVMFNRRRWKPSTTAYGRAAWAAEPTLRAWGMLAGDGLILARTASGRLIRLRNFCHVLLCGGTGSGKGVSVIIPQLLSYKRGSCVCFDTKGDLFTIAAPHRRKNMGQRIIRLAPFGGGTDTLNPLDGIRPDCPTLVDDARAMAEALVVRQGSEPDPHWNDKSVQVICTLLTLVLARFEGKERNLNLVAEIASDPALLEAAADKLREMGGIYARFGNQLRALLDKEQPGTLTKEGAGILSTVGRHLAFLDSDLVAASLARSTFLVKDLLKPGTTLFIQIPPDQLEAAKGLLRLWLSSLIRVIGRGGSEASSEVLFLLDEASSLGSLSALEEALVRGRSAGVRLLLAYQSDSQIRAAFKDKPTLLYDNCDTQVYLGASSYETAERISKMCGDWTQVVSSYGENESRSYSPGGLEGQRQGPQTSRGSSMNLAVQGRNLLRPEEVLTLSRDLLIAFVRGMQPILARRLKYFSDPAFSPAAVRARRPMLLWWALLAASVGLIAWAAWAWW